MLQHCKVYRIIFLLWYFCIVSLWVFAQSVQSSDKSSAVILPNGFGTIMLGDTRDTVLGKLQNSTLFEAYNPPEISVIPDTTQQLLRITGKKDLETRYIMEAIFQFNDTKLVTISLFLDRDVLDYYTLYDTHCKKYGRAQRISTTQAIWENDNVHIILEKPLNIKYIARALADSSISTINTEQRILCYVVQGSICSISTINTEQRIQQRRKEREAFLSLF